MAAARAGTAVLEVVLNVGRMGQAVRQMNQAASAVQRMQGVLGFGNQQMLMGGTGGQTALATGILEAIGLGGDQAAAMASAFRQRIANDPIAAGAASRHGMRALPFDGSRATNEADLLLRQLDVLRKFATEEEALAYARNTGTEALLIWRHATEEQVAAMKQEAQLRAGIYGQKQVRAAAQLMIEQNRLAMAWNDLKVQLGSKLVPVIRWLTEKIQALVQWLASWGVLGNGGQNTQASAINQNTQAVNQNTVAINTMTRQVFGGGPRAQGAVPAGVRGEILRRGLIGNSLNLGAFSL